MGSRGVTCHPTQVNTPYPNPRQLAGTRFTYPGGMEGWVDLGYPIILPLPGGIVIGRVCLLVRSFVRGARCDLSKSKTKKFDFHDTWHICSTYGSNFIINFSESQGQSSSLKPQNPKSCTCYRPWFKITSPIVVDRMLFEYFTSIYYILWRLLSRCLHPASG